MASLIERAQAIKQQQNAAALARQDAAIQKATDFWNRLPSSAQSLRDHQYAAQDAAIERGKEYGAAGVLGLTPDNLGSLGIQVDFGNNVNETPRYKTPTGSAESFSSSSVPPSVLDYLNADLAKYYGMSKSTAYQEALENTSYQRAMKDMKAAGLNPAVMFGTGRANGAGSNVYPSSGGSGGSYSRRSGGSSKNDKLFSTSAYGAIAAIGGLVGIAATGRPDGFWIGSQVSQGAMNLMNAFNKK